VLESMARSYTLPYWQVIRAQMVLMAAEGMRNNQIAAQLRCGRDVISQWRKRFFEQRLAGLGVRCACPAFVMTRVRPRETRERSCVATRPLRFHMR
jgi:hypothetical protein